MERWEIRWTEQDRTGYDDRHRVCVHGGGKRDSSEQVYVRPSKDVASEVLKEARDSDQVFFVPSVSGLGIDEPVYQRPKINQLLGQGKSGDVLRNLLAEISNNQDAWDQLTRLIEDMFGYELLPPDDTGAHILAEYRHSSDGIRLDINSAGSGFLQVLLLLIFLIQRKGSVLLLDGPDAHLHVILQDTIYGQLKKIARESNSQLIIATHSDVVINAVEPRDLLAMLGRPKKLASDDDKSSLIRSLSILSNTDILLAQEKKRILYLERRTDLNILMEWALIPKHSLADFLQRPFWKPVVFETRSRGKGIKSQEHFDTLMLIQEGIRGVQIVDRNGNENIPVRRESAGGNLLKLCWARYEIESYLVHPDSLARFMGVVVGKDAPLASVQAMKEALMGTLPPSAINDPLGNHATLTALKARRDILPPIFDQVGLHGFSYTRYDEIAAVMRPEEIHRDVIEILDSVANHFNL